jgi:hypothetical protein
VDIRTLASAILELEARMAASPEVDPEDRRRWYQLLSELLGLLASDSSTRRSWRVPLSHTCQSVCEGDGLTLVASNLSLTGMGVECDESLSPGTEGELMVAEGGDASFAMNVPFRVVWSRPVPGSSRYQMGLEFERDSASAWHDSFRAWYLHVYTAALRDLASGKQKVD